MYDPLICVSLGNTPTLLNPRDSMTSCPLERQGMFDLVAEVVLHAEKY